jgi:phenylacetate-CoA ligase
VPGLSEIVATGLDNFMMPLIRYRTGDVATWLTVSCPCGRGLPLLGQVQTKMDDAVVTSDGRWISPSVLTFPFKSIRGITKSQIVQRSLTEFTVRIVPEDGFSPREEAKLLAGLHARLGEGITVSVERVADIARTSAGKYRWVVSEVEQNMAPARGNGAASDSKPE